jgi:hypothetical protein
MTLESAKNGVKGRQSLAGCGAAPHKEDEKRRVTKRMRKEE